MAIGGGLAGVVLVLLYLMLGGDPAQLQQGTTAPERVESAAGQDEAFAFSSVILRSTEDAWTRIFDAAGQTQLGVRAISRRPT